MSNSIDKILAGEQAIINILISHIEVYGDIVRKGEDDPHIYLGKLQNLIQQAIIEAKAEERERCYHVAMSDMIVRWSGKPKLQVEGYYNEACDSIAKAIRNLKHNTEELN